MRRIISHRGNIIGENPRLENEPVYVKTALECGYDVEIDVWWVDGTLFLGHDKPEYPIDMDFLTQGGLWIHCKNIQALDCLIEDVEMNVFYHVNDDVTLTSYGYIWTYPGKLILFNSIAVLPERVPNWDIRLAYGVCTDYPLKYKI
jgi:hypothetical protein